jgi:hypothetical protein
VIEGGSDHTLSTAGTTKRHRNSPSVGAMSVSTVVEENEEEEERPSLLRPETQTFNSTPEEDIDEPATPIDEGEDDEDAEEPVPTSSELSQSAAEPEKQSASEEAKADSAAQYAEKHSEESAAEEKPVTEQDLPDVIPEVKDSDDESVGAEDAPSSSDGEATSAKHEKPKEEAAPSTERVADDYGTIA